MFDWNDLRFLLAIARQGSTTAAAKALGVNQSTVHRRLLELERRVGRALVHRHPTGYQLTELGEALRPAIEQVDEAVANVERQVRDYGNKLVGTIRLTCPEPLVSRIAPLLELFHERHPHLRVEFVMSDDYLDLSKGEADVALRSGQPDDETLVGRKIADSIWAVYASRSYVQQNGKPSSIEALSSHTLVGFDGILTNHRAAKWLADVAPNAKVAVKCNSVLGGLMAVKSGVGLAPLPTTIAGMHDDLVQVLPTVPELTRGWYLLANPDLRATPRISAFFNFVVGELELVRTILMG